VIDLSAIELKKKNAHDVEDVALCDFLRMFSSRFNKNSNMLDVGAHHSHAHYAREAKAIFPGTYEGIDVLEDPDTALLLDQYHVGNFRQTMLPGYDLIFSVSALEHCGISTYKVRNYREERYWIARHIFSRASQFVFLTFPFGLGGLVENQYANITDADLHEIDRQAESLSFRPLAFDFYYSEHPQQGKPWKAISREEAAQVPLDPAIEQQTVAVCSWMKI
jgi:hypothetical protein